MSAPNSESRKRREALFSEPQWAPSERDTLKGRVLAALRRVYGDADAAEGDALLDALEDEGVVG